MKKKINVIIVDDSETFLNGMVSFLEKEEKYNVLASFNSGIKLLDYDNCQKADVVLLDIEMPELNGIETCRRINYIYPQIKIIAITMYQDRVYLRELVSAGFKGFVNKTSVPEGLFGVIDLVLQDKFVFPEGINL